MVEKYAEYLVRKFSEELDEKESKKHSEVVVRKEVEDKYIRWLSELSKNDIAVAGGKGANLAEMYNNGFPVPPAFIVTAQAYEHFLKEIKEQISALLKEIDVDNTAELERKAQRIRDFIIQTPLPDNLQNEIIEAY